MARHGHHVYCRQIIQQPVLQCCADFYSTLLLICIIISFDPQVFTQFYCFVIIINQNSTHNKCINCARIRNFKAVVYIYLNIYI